MLQWTYRLLSKNTHKQDYIDGFQCQDLTYMECLQFQLSKIIKTQRNKTRRKENIKNTRKGMKPKQVRIAGIRI